MTAAGTVDFRRFRTWDADPATSSSPAWRILVRYGYVRLTSSWVGRILLVLLALAAVLFVGSVSYAFASGTGVEADAWGVAMLAYGGPLALLLLLVAAPLFAEDLRFNAPLFYFSKPLRVGDYYLGKLVFLASLLGATVLAPILAFLLMALLVGVPAGDPQTDMMYRYYANNDPAALQRYLADWRASHVDSPGEWAAAAAASLPGVVAAIALFAALAVACSVFTRRGWHAGMAFVAIVGGTGIAGAVYADSVEGALGSLGSPIGWTYLMVGLPLEMMFPSHAGPLREHEVEALQGASMAIPLAYVLSVATVAACLWASRRRLHVLEGRL